MKDAASFFKALSDEARLKMLWLLLNRRELCVCDFMEVLGVTQSKASRHLRALHHAGLVTDRREGQWSYYALKPSGDEFVKAHMAALKKMLALRPDAADLLEQLKRWFEEKEKCCH
jgi:ArsR family transcriptional regulator